MVGKRARQIESNWMNSTAPDGIKKKISETELAQRLSPRSKKSSWTELNKERARRLEKLGLMTEAGRKVLPDLSYESFKIDPIIELRLKEESDVYQNFVRFPDLSYLSRPAPRLLANSCAWVRRFQGP